MNLAKIVTQLQIEAGQLAPQTPGAKWYLFGSALRGLDKANDIDVLVVCREERHEREIRGRMGLVRILPPLHLLLMTADEEKELCFREPQGCVEIYPEDVLRVNKKGAGADGSVLRLTSSFDCTF